jgi:hypothetical protein
MESRIFESHPGSARIRQRSCGGRFGNYLVL